MEVSTPDPTTLKQIQARIDQLIYARRRQGYPFTFLFIPIPFYPEPPAFDLSSRIQLQININHLLDQELFRMYDLRASLRAQIKKSRTIHRSPAKTT